MSGLHCHGQELTPDRQSGEITSMTMKNVVFPLINVKGKLDDSLEDRSD